MAPPELTPAATMSPVAQSVELEAFRSRCFWWVRKEVALLQLPREMLIQGLQTHGGREGMRLAARL